MDLVNSVQHLIELIYPPRCLVCRQAGHAGLDLCADCYRTLPWNSNACISCALPLPLTVSQQLRCGRCLQTQPAYDAAFSLFRYEPPVTSLIQQMKFNEKLSIIRLFSQLLQTQLDQLPTTECLLPVPLHNKRLRQRGFNQSIEIARPLTTMLAVPLENHTVQRTRDTAQQTGLDAATRRKNIKHAFQVIKPLNYKNITIVDDVVTTGSTVNELARVLKKAGADTVNVISLARAVKT